MNPSIEAFLLSSLLRMWRWQRLRVRCGYLTLVITLTACTSSIEDRARADHERLQQRAEAATRQLRPTQESRPPSLLTVEDTMRFTRRSVPFDSGQLLPAQIQSVTMKAAGLHSLKTVSQWLENLTRIPVTVTPDALMPASAFELDLNAQGSGAGSAGSTTGADAQPDVNQQAAQAIERHGGPRQLPSDKDPPHFSVDYHGPLQGLLEQVATRAGVHWTYKDGAIRFYRVVSRSIPVRSLPGNLTQSGGVQLSSGMSLTSEVELNIWAGIERSVQQMISRQGRVRVDPALGQVLVRDALHNVEAVEHYLEGVNRQLARQVSLNVEVLQVSLNNRFQTGIDWNYVRQVTGMGTFSAGALPSVVGNTANVGFFKNNDDGSVSNLIIKALESFGRVSTSYSSVINTMNRQPVPLGAISTQSYLKQITPSSTSTSTGSVAFGPPGLTPGEIVTGFNLTLLPIVLDSNMVLMQCGISISSLRELTNFSSGTGAAQQTLQQPNVSSFLTLQRMAVRSGDTIVLSGFETESTDSKQNDLKRDAVPGTRTSARDKNTLVVLITPRLMEF
jgi:type IVB pilus formation R64 PilN family outer membrane protein